MHCVLAACGTLVHIVSSLCTARAHRVITACGHDVTTCVRGALTQHGAVGFRVCTDGLKGLKLVSDDDAPTRAPARPRDQMGPLFSPEMS
ncbi:hypothetical protein PR003_g16034 [Phytophthora rubi]|uniref:Secreted protein n=1 Tax=Phytophthora rubi TaxID=129364 RepID=A0A6A4EU30_9STRA|nr:hypothetical protein PR002_g24075 [Phytophthora rubi]KAE9010683.1 hypothetical protein PR001_g16110 [Phytophthora rubi]KAE9327340.1 hypothetical protein PR003_g16034 [Phytophthora rubi]